MKLKFGKDLKNVNMKKLFRRNQIIVTTLAIMIAAAGYLNYAQKAKLEDSGAYEAGATDISQEDILAENQNYLNLQGDYEEIQSLDQDWDQIEEAESLASDAGTESNAGASEGNGEDSALASDTGTSGQPAGTSLADNTGEEGGAETGFENPGEAILTSGMSVSDYIAGVQLSREQVRARNKETLLNIINNTAIEESAKQEAIQSMIELTEIAEKENAAETLLMAKGFADPVVSISADKVDVVINAASITDPQRAQIEDVVKRKAEVGAENIIITLLNLDN